MLHYAEGGAPMATLLIVEDDIDTNEAVCEYLQDAGHSTVSAFDGDEAIKLFAERKFLSCWILCCPPLRGWLF